MAIALMRSGFKSRRRLSGSDVRQVSSRTTAAFDSVVKTTPSFFFESHIEKRAPAISERRKTLNQAQGSSLERAASSIALRRSSENKRDDRLDYSVGKLVLLTNEGASWLSSSSGAAR